MACPYEAPRLIEISMNGAADRVASVDANLCMGCGICVAACPTGAIARPGVSNQDLKDRMIVSTGNGDPRLVTFVCDWCLRADADLEILASYPENVRVVHIPCSGRIDPEMALRALKAGIDGVLVCGCQPGECHYQRGTFVSDCKLSVLDRMLSEMEIGSGKVRFVQIGTTDRGRIRMEINSMLEDLEAWKEAH